ncbi:plasma protease C1 inhibitor isoform X1 [Pelobates cultripes]|uniref:Plasma protease C1 inhibitor isoform X1 n=1 Tax=Pelobates cultripes TaxID=61616 RepID=A0AAD1T8K2_PELCU|nr:plasma protease C1 inhibitor isoform X1 [Pelobates cultripes]
MRLFTFVFWQTLLLIVYAELKSAHEAEVIPDQANQPPTQKYLSSSTHIEVPLSEYSESDKEVRDDKEKPTEETVHSNNSKQNNSVSQEIEKEKLKENNVPEVKVKNESNTESEIKEGAKTTEDILSNGIEEATTEKNVPEVKVKNESNTESEIKEGAKTTEKIVINGIEEATTTAYYEPCSSIWPNCTKDNLVNATEQVAKSITSFSVDLYKLLSQNDNEPNLVIAPISVAMALSHLMLGTGKQTREVMLENLYKEVTDTQCIHEVLRNMFNKDAFVSASEIFYKKGMSLNDEFIIQSMKYYESRGQELLNEPKESLKQINSWVSDKTFKRIPKLLQELPRDLQLLLINVIYYQGKWLTRFDVNLTKKGSFKKAGSMSVTVPMMNNHKYSLQSFRDKHLKAQVARFTLSSNISLIIILPFSNEDITAVGNRLNEGVVHLLIKELQSIPPRATSVTLPRLKLDSNSELQDMLKKLGLYSLFDYPDFCGLSTQSELAVDEVYHRSVLEVAEHGVAAVAASTVSVARTLNTFEVRKPFLFMLASDITGIPLFIGHVNDPSK